MQLANQNYNIYCDESCHLENDHQKAMVLGAAWCPVGKTREIAIRLREIKQKHGLAQNFEIKWTKISPAKKEFYLDFLDSKPVFQGRRLGLKRHPLSQGKEATFWHMISEGTTEEKRTPDFRRCERIR